ncbi:MULTISPECIES: transglutaminase-like domain-containing protein, partial [unclassified Endozoicomonas]|uniref:transglutaminase-like domain-containing protein n=1 Tax=unclassified Endozoicomonas TaxID=2644528 RepID=UPI002147778F
RSTWFDAVCSEGMKTVLDELFTNIEQQTTEIREPLRKIAAAQGTAERIQAITEYCEQFSGGVKPKRKENFFKFLVTRRQGSCRHRVPVFIALCRYFGIPCRQMTNTTHIFAECSGDGGQTWMSVDLGGAPVKDTKVIPKFQPTRKVHSSSAAPKKIKDPLKGADLAQQQTLAKACATSPEKTNKALQTNSALPETIPSTFQMAKNLWGQKDSTSFAMGVSLLSKSALPKTIPSTFQTVKNLWGQKDSTSFAMGVSLLSKTKALSDDEKKLLGVVALDDQDESAEDIPRFFDMMDEVVGGPGFDLDWRNESRDYKPMSEAVIQILFDNDEDQVSEQLESLYSKMIIQGGANPQEWLSSMVYILSQSDLNKPSVIQFALKAMESGWLDPLPDYDRDIINASEHHELLVSLEGIDELKVKADHCLKKFYNALLSKEKNSEVWRSNYKKFQRETGDTLLVTHCHDGFSPSLENKIAHRSIQDVWTNNPEGIPNIERMLVQQPAFPQLNSGRGKHRPVIIMGEPSWWCYVIDEKVQAMLERKAENSPQLKRIMEKNNQYELVRKQLLKDLEESDEAFSKKERLIEAGDHPSLTPLKMSDEEKKTLDDFKTKCKQAIEHALSHYLYGLTHSKGGCLTYCWVEAIMNSETGCTYFSYGAHDPSSPEELFAMMSDIYIPRSVEESIKDAYLRQAHNGSDALVLKSKELNIIAGEFLGSVNLNSMSESLDI